MAATIDPRRAAGNSLNPGQGTGGAVTAETLRREHERQNTVNPTKEQRAVGGGGVEYSPGNDPNTPGKYPRSAGNFDGGKTPKG